MTNKEAIDTIKLAKAEIEWNYPLDYQVALDMAIESLSQDPLTDKEQRIFLAAMSREEKVCKEVDAEYPYKEPYEDSLVSVCRSIERKVRKALWT